MWRQIKDCFWPVLQQSLAVVLAWSLAHALLDQALPIFAPISALVALNTPRGGRGANAVRVVLGVIAGVLIGEAAYYLIGSNALAVGVATLFALLVTQLIDPQRITMAQSGVSAVISVVAGTQAGHQRTFEVLIGGGVALLFSQLLFPAHPLATLRRAESNILRVLSDVLFMTSQSLDGPKREPQSQLWEQLRPVYEELVMLGAARDNILSAVRHVPFWWGQREPVQRESNAARDLDLLSNSCLTLARAAMDTTSEHRGRLAPEVRELSHVLRMLAAAPDSRSVRRHAARRALKVAGDVSLTHAGTQQVAISESVLLVVRDVLVFLGTPDKTANRVVHERAHNDEDTVEIGNPARLSLPNPAAYAPWPSRRRRAPRERPRQPQDSQGPQEKDT
ncbi:aromatic acid exporter family protein [Streptomyces polyrhachis]|uniref:Aromatic acid exporter family protein n=1 Tax=Streptomyces polyrhachis TaxID=1282885 RepID=A0ABW2GJG8_9ACTN